MQARLEGWSRGVVDYSAFGTSLGLQLVSNGRLSSKGVCFIARWKRDSINLKMPYRKPYSGHCDGAFHLRASAELALFPMRQRPVSQEWTGPRHPWTSSDSGSVPTGSVPPPDPRLSKSSLRIQRGPSSSAMCKHVQACAAWAAWASCCTLL